jgi:hypothetical protein
MVDFHVFYEKSVTFISIGTILFVVTLLVFLTIGLCKQKNTTNLVVLFFVYLTTIVPLFIVFLYAPKSYTVNSENIIIKKKYDRIIIPKNEVKQILYLTQTELAITHRKFASGGFFGYFGKFGTNKLGDVSIYAGSISSNLVLIEKTNGTKYVITPKEIEQFKTTMKSLSW